MLLRLFIAAAALTVLILACVPPYIPDARTLDGYVTTAQTQCRSAKAPQKVATCKRSLACLQAAQQAQHAMQTALLTMSRMEDSYEDRAIAAASYQGAVAVCKSLGIGPGGLSADAGVFDTGSHDAAVPRDAAVLRDATTPRDAAVHDAATPRDATVPPATHDAATVHDAATSRDAAPSIK
ncbi:MAG: hypothetical protein E6Q97_07095 [Desulfurellales bacterium]|nr:MAG: hypothetical protein E6Q97_07095 [Desulfurellales bacterium]